MVTKDDFWAVEKMVIGCLISSDFRIFHGLPAAAGDVINVLDSFWTFHGYFDTEGNFLDWHFMLRGYLRAKVSSINLGIAEIPVSGSGGCQMPPIGKGETEQLLTLVFFIGKTIVFEEILLTTTYSHRNIHCMKWVSSVGTGIFSLSRETAKAPWTKKWRVTFKRTILQMLVETEVENHWNFKSIRCLVVRCWPECTVV